MSILKLAVGAPVTFKVASADVVQGKFRPDVKFMSTDGDTIFVGEEVATRQLGRFALNPTTVVGKTLKFEKVEKEGKTFTNIDVSGAKGNGTGGPAIAGAAGGGQSAASNITPPVTTPAPVPESGHALYEKITAYVLKTIVPQYRQAGLAMTPEAITSCVHTLYIQASRR